MQLDDLNQPKIEVIEENIEKGEEQEELDLIPLTVTSAPSVIQEAANVTMLPVNFFLAKG